MNMSWCLLASCLFNAYSYVTHMDLSNTFQHSDQNIWTILARLSGISLLHWLGVPRISTNVQVFKCRSSILSIFEHWAIEHHSMGSRWFQGVQMFGFLASCDASGSFILQHVVRKQRHSASSFNLQHPMLVFSGYWVANNFEIAGYGYCMICVCTMLIAYMKWLCAWDRAKSAGRLINTPLATPALGR